MFNRREGQAQGTTLHDSEAFVGFALGCTLTLAIVLVMNLLLPAHAVENHVVEVAKQALYEIPLPP